jgi:DNA primase
MKMIIDFDPDAITPSDALRRVALVVDQGRVSEALGMKHYCWLTAFKDGIAVYTRRKKRNQKSDSFLVGKR